MEVDVVQGAAVRAVVVASVGAAAFLWFSGCVARAENRGEPTPRVREIAAKLPSVKKVVVVPYTRAEPPLDGIRDAVSLHEFTAPFQAKDIHFERLPFEHPLYILYSSGTTGVPKCIVHGAGGTLLQHMKEHQLHVDLEPGDRFFYFTTCGWMMWNWLVSGLASRATLVLYDGSPFVKRGRILWDYAQEAGINIFGTAAKFIDAIAKLGLTPAQTHQLPALRALLSTGSPLAPESDEESAAADDGGDDKGGKADKGGKGDKADKAAKDADIAGRRTRFEAGLKAMKDMAEK
mgnify:CR=1 FL=1